MAQQIDLETLHHILKQYSEDVFSDCPKIVSKLLSSLDVTARPDYCKTLKSIKVLLNLYERLYTEGNKVEIKLPVGFIFDKIKKVCSGSDGCAHPDDDVQLQFLSILHSLSKMSSLKNTDELLQELLKLHNHSMACIGAASAGREWRSHCLMFNLKMVHNIYALHGDLLLEAEIQELVENSRSDSVNYCKVLANLVLHGDNNLAVETLTSLIPGYSRCFGSDMVLEVIWKETSSLLSQSSIEHGRVMLILCSFFDTFFDKLKPESKSHVNLLFRDGNYWETLQSVLVKSDPTIRKQGMYLLRKTVEVLQSTDESITCCKENLIFSWDPNFKDTLCGMYSNIIIIVEFLEEAQVHIVKPILAKAEDLLGRIVACGEVSPSWVLLVHQKALAHESTQVVKWGLGSLLSLPGSFFAREDIARQTLALLVPALNNPALYYADGLALSEQLRAFLREVAGLGTSQVILSAFIRQVCALVWSPEPLFFVTHAALEFPRCSCWGEEEISHIRGFVKRAFNTYHKVVRVGIQCQLLSAVLALTDEKRVSLNSFILLVSSFPLMESVEREGRTWREVVGWTRASYSVAEAERVLESYKRGELGKEFNEKCTSLMFSLLYCSFEHEVGSLVVSQLSETLLLFKDVERRLYCDRSSLDQQVGVIREMYAASASDSVSEMLRPTLPLVKHVLSYIRSRLKQISGLQEFETCQLYLSAFEKVAKAQKSGQDASGEIGRAYSEVLEDLKECLHSEASIGLYCRVKFLNILQLLHPCDADLSFLVPYLLANVNEPLEKDGSCSEQSRDIQTLWGRMNSEFIGGKWKLLELLVSSGRVVGGPGGAEGRSRVSDSELVRLCVEGLSTGGYGVLRPVMSVLRRALPALERWSEVGAVVGSVWRVMMERRKTEEMKLLVKGFVEMVFQEALVARGGGAEEMLMEYADLILSDSSLAVVTALMRHIQRMDLAACSASLFCHIVGKALTFGPVERKDERLTTCVCACIERCRICPVWGTGAGEGVEAGRGEREHCGAEGRKGGGASEGPVGSEWAPPREYYWPAKLSDHCTSGEIRARAVERVLGLKGGSPAAQGVAGELAAALLRLSGDAGGQRGRYFGNSHVHRVKHRVAQALLVLQPLLPRGKGERGALSDWLYGSLLNESLQPSVRYLQEWLLIRVLVEDADLCGGFFKYLEISRGVKKTGLCSLMAVGLHVALLRSPRLAEPFIDAYIETLLKYLFHQNFEVRLHAQVVICKLQEIADSRKLTEVTRRWGDVFLVTNQVCSHMQDQRLRHFLKLKNDFFFDTFDALKHYSLQVIYTDLPRLTNVGSDEWIHKEMFQYCGVDPSTIGIPLENAYSCLKYADIWERRDGPNTESECEDERPEDASENYQRKVAPTKPPPLLGDAEERGCPGESKDGLVVVASLIDRVPNLGGLARTCEVFGASEYVVGSLKCKEDKQFTSLSVTAEKWINMKEVKPQNLKYYLLDMKRNGYVVVGAEQTLRSQSLGSVKFPKKTLLLLGNEKEGIPPNLLPFLDVCVEIPQKGIIRSLNVHVSGALFIWEYAKQIHFS